MTYKEMLDQPGERRSLNQILAEEKMQLQQEKEKDELWRITANPSYLFEIKEPTDDEILYALSLDATLASQLQPEVLSDSLLVVLVQKGYLSTQTIGDARLQRLADKEQLELIKLDHTIAKKFKRLSWDVVYYLEAFHSDFIKEEHFLDILSDNQVKYLYKGGSVYSDWQIGFRRARKKYPKAGD